jgi:hypothetical protein
MAEINNDNLIPDFDLPVLELEQELGTEVQEAVKEETKETIVTEDIDPKAKAYFEELKSRGYVDESKEFQGTWEELDEYFDTLPQQVLDSVVQSLPEVSKDVMRFIATAGENITKDEMKNFFNTYFEEQENKSLNIETADDAREFLENHFKELGLRPKAITSTLDALEEDDELLDEAKKIFEEKNKESKVNKIIEDKNNQNTEKEQQLKERVEKIQEELKTIGWKQEVVKEVTKVLSGNNLNTNLTKIITNPKGLIQLANLTRLYNEKTGEFDLSAFVKQIETKTTTSLKDRLENEAFSSSGVSTKHRDANPNPQNGFEGLELQL